MGLLAKQIVCREWNLFLKIPVPGISRRWHKTTLSSTREPSPAFRQNYGSRGCNAARGPRAPRAPLPWSPGDAQGRPATPPGVRAVPAGTCSLPRAGWECPLGISAAVWGLRRRGHACTVRGRAKAPLPAVGAVAGDPASQDRGGAGAPGGRGPPVKFGVRSVRSGAGAGVSRAGLPERGAYWSESWKAWGPVSAGRRRRGPRPPRRVLRRSPVGRPGRLHLGEAAGARLTCAREVGGGGVSLPAQLFFRPSLFSWPRPSAASGRGGCGERPGRPSPRSSAVARFKSTVAPSPPGWPSCRGWWWGFPAGDACRARVTFGAVPTPHPERCSTTLGTVFYSFSCAFALGLAESKSTPPSVSSPASCSIRAFFFFYPHLRGAMTIGRKKVGSDSLGSRR